MKVYVLAPNEDWICDRFVREWNEDNADISVNNPRDADVIWLFADWCWQHIADPAIFNGKKVLTTVHHIVPEKFNAAARLDFSKRDSLTSEYQVFNQRTHDFIRGLTNKKITIIPYWANQKIWRKTGEKLELRKKYGLPSDAYIIGSFQRDTEGSDLKTPKFEKGPDLLADFIIKKNQERIQNGDIAEIHVLLAGWRRQYIINRLKEANVRYTYLERPPHDVVNELYQTLDLYPVSARVEGGPQSLIECGLLNVPVVSRPVGIAEYVLPPESINHDLSKATANVPTIAGLELPTGYLPYRKLLQSL